MVFFILLKIIAAFINTYSAIKDNYLVINMFIKRHAKRNTILIYLLWPNCLQFTINFYYFY